MGVGGGLGGREAKIKKALPKSANENLQKRSSISVKDEDQRRKKNLRPNTEREDFRWS